MSDREPEAGGARLDRFFIRLDRCVSEGLDRFLVRLDRFFAALDRRVAEGLARCAARLDRRVAEARHPAADGSDPVAEGEEAE